MEQYEAAKADRAREKARAEKLRLCEETRARTLTLDGSPEGTPQSMLAQLDAVQRCGQIPPLQRTIFAKAHADQGRAIANTDPKQAVVHFRAALQLDETIEAARSGTLAIFATELEETSAKGSVKLALKEYGASEEAFRRCLAIVDDIRKMSTDPDAIPIPPQVEPACKDGLIQATGQPLLAEGIAAIARADVLLKDGVFGAAIPEYEVAVENLEEAKAKLGDDEEVLQALKGAAWRLEMARLNEHSDGRRAYAEQLIAHYRGQGIVLDATTEDRAHTVMRVVYKDIDLPWVTVFRADTAIVEMKELQFAKIILTDGGSGSWTVPLQ